VLIAAGENSTKPIHVRSHSGIVRVKRYSFSLTLGTPTSSLTLCK